jgi:hypothetical protein
VDLIGLVGVEPPGLVTAALIRVLLRSEEEVIMGVWIGTDQELLSVGSGGE